MSKGPLEKLKSFQKWLIILIVLGFAGMGLFQLKKMIDQKISGTVSSKISKDTGDVRFYDKDGVQFRDTNWKELVQLDYKTGERGGSVAEFENKMVRIPGYIVPLTDEVAVLDEFLFVPNDQACIHVPPPPPNLIVKAKLKHKMNFEDVYNPSWLMGKLEIVKTTSQYGSAAYQIQDAELEKYVDESP